MADAQRLMAKLCPLLHQLPELTFIAFRGAGHIYKVQRHRSLIEAPVVFVTAIWIHAHRVWREERPAAHAGVHISLELLHHLG